MFTGFVLIRVGHHRVHAAAQEVLEIKDVTEVYSVAGRYDLIAVIRVRDADQLAKLVTDEISAVEGILGTTTLVAIRQYSEQDVERVFSLVMA